MKVYITELSPTDETYVGMGARIVARQCEALGHEVTWIPPTAATTTQPDVWLVSLPYAGNVRYLAEWRRLNPPNVHRVDILGGHGIINPSAFLDMFDGVYLGEADDVLGDILGNLDSLDSLPGMATVASPSAVYQHAETMDCRTQYRSMGTSAKGLGDTVYIEAAKGCRHRCLFCEVGYVAKYQERSLDEVIDVAGNLFRGGTFHKSVVLSAPDTGGVSWFNEAISDGTYRPRWRSTRIREYLKAPPCKPDGVRKRIRFGVEGVTEHLRASIKKPISDEQLWAAFDRATSEWYRTFRLFFIAGLPGETRADRYGFLRFMEQLKRKKICHWKAVDCKLTAFSPQPFTPLERCGVGLSVDAIGDYRRMKSQMEKADPYWRQVIVGESSTEADVVRHMTTGQLSEYLTLRPRGHISRAEVERVSLAAGFDYDKLVTGYGATETLPWADYKVR